MASSKSSAIYSTNLPQSDMVSNLCSRPITRIAKVLQVRTEIYWKGCTEKLSPSLSWALNSLKILIIKKCRVVWQHSFFFHEPVFSNSQANVARSDTASVTHDSVYLHCNNMTCLSTLNVWQTALFSQNKCINNMKICETVGGFCFGFVLVCCFCFF